MSVPQWNADIITPDAPASDTPIATNGGLEKNQSGELGVSVDGSTVTINEEGQLEAAGGGSGESCVDIPMLAWSDTPTTWQTIEDYVTAHNGLAPIGFCSGDNRMYYPIEVSVSAKEIKYQSITPWASDPNQNVVEVKRLNDTGWYGFTELIVPNVPSFNTTSDVGRVLQVTANGLAWVTP